MSGAFGVIRLVPLLDNDICHHGEPEVVTIDNSGANTAALAMINATKREESITIRQSKYLNNLVEQEHRNITGRTVLSVERLKNRLGYFADLAFLMRQNLPSLLAKIIEIPRPKNIPNQ